MWERNIVTYAPLNAAGIEQLPSNLGANLHHPATASAMGRSSHSLEKIVLPKPEANYPCMMVYSVPR